MTALWLAIAAMTGAAIFVVLAALARHRSSEVQNAGADVAVYRDQMGEIDRDRARGLIDEREAEGARVEVGRRLIAAAERGEGTDGAANDGRRRIAAVAALVLVPLIAIGGYAALGRPDLRDLPLSARKGESPANQNIADLVTRVETALAKDPNDGRGWAVVAPIYMRLGRADDAARAYANAIRILGPTPEREADLGEALFAAADGVVTGDARAAFERSTQGETPSLKGAVYLARAKQQDGDLPGALAQLKALLAKAAPGAPDTEALRDELQRLAEVPPLPMPNITDADRQKTPEERMAMVRTMVDGLDGRLQETGGDVGEWLRLVQARSALGDAAKARDALAKAREKFGADVRSAARIDALALGLGLTSDGA